jgi:hypothetical protein
MPVNMSWFIGKPKLEKQTDTHINKPKDVKSVWLENYRNAVAFRILLNKINED